MSGNSELFRFFTFVSIGPTDSIVFFTMASYCAHILCVCVCVSQGHECCFFFLIRVGHPQILLVNACTTRQDTPNTCQSITESSFLALFFSPADFNQCWGIYFETVTCDL